MNRLLALVITATLAASVALAGEEAPRSGTLEGKSGHRASGSVSIVESEDGWQLILGEDFVFDGAPDPKLGFGRSGFVPATLFSPLESNQGEQSYPIPPTIDPADYDEFWIWCERYDVALAVAELEPTLD